ncbi:Pentatricopeptide repeat-containing protein [Nymphaea thermarum]|nr:Pentatricopeptide repeat-containing protein [Nymphaea thermarum]
MLHRKQVAWNSMLLAYVSSDQLQPAGHLFEEMPQRNSTLYLIMINRLSRGGSASEHSHVQSMPALFGMCMWDDRVTPNGFTFVVVMKSCVELKSIAYSVQIHALAVNPNCGEGEKESDYVYNWLMNMYAKCGDLGLLENGNGEEALWLFVHLLQSWSDSKSNLSTDSIVITICFTSAALEQGRQIHAKIIKCGGASFLHVWHMEICMSGILQLNNFCQLSVIVLSLYNISKYLRNGRFEESRDIRKLVGKRGLKKEPGCSWIRMKNHIEADLLPMACREEEKGHNAVGFGQTWVARAHLHTHRRTAVPPQDVHQGCGAGWRVKRWYWRE